MSRAIDMTRHINEEEENAIGCGEGVEVQKKENAKDEEE